MGVVWAVEGAVSVCLASPVWGMKELVAPTSLSNFSVRTVKGGGLQRNDECK